MISNKNITHIHKAIKEFNKLVDKTFLIAFTPSKSQPLQFMEIQIKQNNFWHLVGCQIDKNLGLDDDEKEELYKNCFKGDDVSKFLKYTRKPNKPMAFFNSKDIPIKSLVVLNIFNFIDNAKKIRIVDAKGTGDAHIYEIGIGSGIEKAIIGYRFENNYYVPITSLEKSIFNVDKNANNKIVIILSKESKHQQYDKIEYEVGKGLFRKLVLQFKDKFPLSNNLMNNLKE